MPKLTREEVLKLAQLSNIVLTEEQIVQFQNDLGDILTYVDQLQSVDVDGLKPTYQVSGLENSTRPDTITADNVAPEDMRAIVPQTEKDYIKVGRMI